MKINVIGTSASGKTTFSRKLSRIMGVPYLEMDRLFWRAGWRSVSNEELSKKLELALTEKSWVLDGNYSKTTDIKWKNIDLVIWLDYSFIRTVYQSISRAVSRTLSKKELWPQTGNIETFARLLSKDSIILWSIKCYFPNRRKYKKMMRCKEYSHIKFVHLKSPEESKKYLINS